MTALPTPYFSDGQITIYHADCRDILPLIDLATIDLVLTDPPYGIGWKRGANTSRNCKPHAGILNDEDTSVRDEALALLSDVPAIVFGSFYAPYPPNTKQVLVWNKPADSGVVGSTTGYRRDVEPVFLVGPWPITTVKWTSLLVSYAGSIARVTTETGHPHTKPIGLIRTLLERFRPTRVIDVFMGSGTTLKAAKELGIEAIGIELEERYCATAVRRLQQSVLPMFADVAIDRAPAPASRCKGVA